MRDNTGIAAMIHSSATEWRHKFRLEITRKGFGRDVWNFVRYKSYGEEKLSIYTKSQPTKIN